MRRTLLANKKPERGIGVLRDLVQLLPDNAEAHYKLGQALRQKGDVAGAISNLENATTLDPNNADFHLELGQAYIAAGRAAEGRAQIDISKQLKSKAQKAGSP